MFCRSCGAELNDDWKACPKCLTLVDEKSTISYSPTPAPEKSGFSWGKTAIVIGFVLIGFYALIPNNKPTPISHTSISPIKPISPTDYIQILSGWTWNVDRYGYSKINGSLKNVGSKTISYFEITAEYLSEDGKVLDTAYTNSLEKVRPGNEKRFEIMHKDSSDFKKARIFPSKVRLE